MKLYVLIITLILVLLFFTFSIYYYIKNTETFNNNIKQNSTISSNVIDNKNYDKNINNNLTHNNSVSGQDKGSLNSSKGESLNNGASSEKGKENNIPEKSNPVENNLRNLPEDAYTVPCGFYYNSYQFCNGTCPEGVCVSEDRSCYCKKI
ncbi:MAG: hypothetical protein QXW97_04260 [Candidatus Pacearchaeota archaeon]